MDWEDLRAMWAVARHGTLTAAAREHGLTASTLHRRIAALEADLGASVFVKTPRGYTLTPLGQSMVTHLQDMEEAALSARRVILGNDATAYGQVRLTMVGELLPLVADALPSLNAQCPGVELLVQASTSVLDISRDTDLALRLSLSPPEAAVGRRIGTVAWATYATTPGPGAWIAYHQCDHLMAVRWRQQHHGTEPVLARADGVAAVHHLVTKTTAQAVLPCFVGDVDPRLVRLGEVIPEATTELWLVMHADLRRAARVRAVVDVLVAHLSGVRDLLAGTLPCGAQG